MSDPPPRTERGLRERQREAERLMRRAEWAAYIQGALCGVAYLLVAINAHDWLTPIFLAVLGVVLAGLGYRVGRGHSAGAALVLVVIVLGGAVLQLVRGGRPPALIFVAVFAWIYGQAFGAAREHATLRVVPLEPEPPAA